MAFVSLFLAFLFIAVLILGFMFFVGAVLLIIGIVRRKNPKNQGKKSPIVCIVLGVMFLLPPVGTGVIVTGTLVKELIVSHRNYEIVTDEWRAHFVSNEKAMEDVTKQMIKAVNDNDRETIEKLFTKTARERQGFERELDEFLEKCPDLSGSDLDYATRSVKYERDDKNTESQRYGHHALRTVKDGETYYFYAYFCLENDDPDEVGLLFFCVQNEKGADKRIDFTNRSLACEIEK